MVQVFATIHGMSCKSCMCHVMNLFVGSKPVEEVLQKVPNGTQSPKQLWFIGHSTGYYILGVSINVGSLKNVWFVMENPSING